MARKSKRQRAAPKQKVVNPVEEEVVVAEEEVQVDLEEDIAHLEAKVEAKDRRRKRANERAYNLSRPDPGANWDHKELGHRCNCTELVLRRKSPDGKTRVYFFQGGVESNPPTVEKISKCLIKPKYRKWFGYIVKLALEEKLYKRGASGMEKLAPYQGCSFLVAEGVYFSFTHRAWADVCQAIEGDHKRSKGQVDFVNRGYLAFYP